MGFGLGSIGFGLGSIGFGSGSMGFGLGSIGFGSGSTGFGAINLIFIFNSLIYLFTISHDLPVFLINLLSFLSEIILLIFDSSDLISLIKSSIFLNLFIVFNFSIYSF